MFDNFNKSLQGIIKPGSEHSCYTFQFRQPYPKLMKLNFHKSCVDAVQKKRLLLAKEDPMRAVVFDKYCYNISNRTGDLGVCIERVVKNDHFPVLPLPVLLYLAHFSNHYFISLVAFSKDLNIVSSYGCVMLEQENVEERLFIPEPQGEVVQITDKWEGQTHSFQKYKTANARAILEGFFVRFSCSVRKGFWNTQNILRCM